jgi:hypothetical protein
MDAGAGEKLAKVVGERNLLLRNFKTF